MKLLLILFLTLNPFTDLDKIAQINKAKKEAKKAYLEGNYQVAHDKYKLLIDSLSVEEEEVLLDYSHTLYQLNDTTNAVENYQQLSTSTNAKISSIAEQQLGQVMFDKKQYKPALEHYKNALKRNPNNQDARYNYELLKKVIQEQEKQQEQNKDQDQDQNQDQKNQEQENKEEQKKNEQNKDGQNENQENKEQEQKDQEQQQKEKEQEKQEGQKDKSEEDKKEEQQDQQQQEGEKSEEEKKKEPTPSPSDKLKEMNISEEKAKMILEAMKNNEIQYIQQNRRKATKKKESGKPDW